MQQLIRLNSMLSIFAVAFAVCVSTVVFPYLRDRLDSGYVAGFVTLVTVAFSIRIVESSLKSILLWSKTARNLVMGGAAIEGVWYDYTRDIKGEALRHVVILRIHYKNDAYVVSGSTFAANGDRVATFRSTSAAYQDNLLFYQYEGHKEYGDNPVELGVARLQFDFPAESYTGFWFDYSGNERGRVRGERVQSVVAVKHGGLMNIASKAAYARELLQQLVARSD